MSILLHAASPKPDLQPLKPYGPAGQALLLSDALLNTVAYLGFSPLAAVATYLPQPRFWGIQASEIWQKGGGRSPTLDKIADALAQLINTGQLHSGFSLPVMPEDLLERLDPNALAQTQDWVCL